MCGYDGVMVIFKVIIFISNKFICTILIHILILQPPFLLIITFVSTYFPLISHHNLFLNLHIIFLFLSFYNYYSINFIYFLLYF